MTTTGLHSGFVTWGFVSWLLHDIGPHLTFEGEDEDPVLLLTATSYHRGILGMIPTLAIQTDITLSRSLMFSTIASIIAWCIWKARCSEILSSEPSSTVDTLAKVWSELIHSLRSLWDASTGSSRAAE